MTIKIINTSQLLATVVLLSSALFSSSSEAYTLPEAHNNFDGNTIPEVQINFNADSSKEVQSYDSLSSRFLQAYIRSESSMAIQYSGSALPRRIRNGADFSQGRNCHLTVGNKDYSCRYISYVNEKGTSYTDILEVNNSCTNGPLCHEGYMTIANYEHTVINSGQEGNGNAKVQTEIHLVNEDGNILNYKGRISMDISSSDGELVVNASTGNPGNELSLGSMVASWSGRSKSSAESFVDSISRKDLQEFFPKGIAPDSYVVSGMVGAAAAVLKGQN